MKILATFLLAALLAAVGIWIGMRNPTNPADALPCNKHRTCTTVANTTPPTTPSTLPTTTSTTTQTGYLFDDEFDGVGAPDPSKWWVNPWCASDSTLGQTCFNTVNAFQSGGNLVLRVSQGTMGRNYDGARINTYIEGQRPLSSSNIKATVSPPVRLETRAKLPSGAGLWPSFWPNSVGSVYLELDVFENRMFQPNIDGCHTHGSTVYDSYVDAGVDLSLDFHVYWANYYQDHVVFGVDSLTCGQVNVSGIPVGLTFWNVVGDPNQWGGQGGPTPYSLLPADLLVDYVRASRI